MKTQNATIHIIDDDPGMLQYLSDLVATLDYPCKTYSNADDFLKLHNDDGIGCLVLDLRLPGISGLELHQQLKANGIDLPVIMISGFGDISTAVRAMKAGILDFLEKPFKGQDLLDLIHKAIEKHKESREQKASESITLEKINLLTKREKEVMNLVVIGLLNKNIAKKLEISVKTVEVHRASVMDKMQASSVADLVRKTITVEEK